MIERVISRKIVGVVHTSIGHGYPQLVFGASDEGRGNLDFFVN